ncbi:MAG: hypothetical protein JKX85_00500 [Phycisphaeraceae bacterium]|nr:hypothetical protein [Phycisphaeraceae bacterium]
MSIEELTQFLGWCSVINLAVLIVVAVFIISLRGPILKIHGRLFGLQELELSRLYFQFLAFYKSAVIILNLVPYIALKIMA